MHELSIAQSLIASVLAEMNKHQLRSVKTIALRIGPWSGVMAEALQFNFDLLRLDTPLRDAQLVIVETSPQARCPNCQKSFAVEQMNLICPQCGAEPVQIEGGDELDIIYLDPGE